MKNSLTRFKFLLWQFFSLLFITFNIPFCNLLTTFVNCEKSAFLPLLLISDLYLCGFFFFFNLFFCNSQSSLNLWMNFFSWILESSSSFFPQIVFLSIISHFPFWNSNYIYIFMLIFIKTQISIFFFFPLQVDVCFSLGFIFQFVFNLKTLS